MTDLVETDDPVVAAEHWLRQPGVPSVSSSIRLVKLLLREVKDLRRERDNLDPADPAYRIRSAENVLHHLANRRDALPPWARDLLAPWVQLPKGGGDV